MKRTLTLMLALVMVFALSVSGVAYADEAPATNEIRLGRSFYYIDVPADYVLTPEEEAAPYHVAYFKSENSLMDFDVYELDADTLSGLGIDLGTVENVDVLKTVAAAAGVTETGEYQTGEVAGIEVAYVSGTAAWDGETYKVGVYGFKAYSSFVTIVFWLDGEGAEEQSSAILSTLHKSLDTTIIPLGDSGYSLKATKDFVLTPEEETAPFRIAYYASNSTLMDFDVYEIDADVLSADGYDIAAVDGADALKVVVGADVTENSEYQAVEVAGVQVAFVSGTADWEGVTYDVAVYGIKADSSYVVIVFWLDGANALEQSSAILSTLAQG